MDANSQTIFSAAYSQFLTVVDSSKAALLASLLVAQSKEETASFTSNAFLQDNNCGGYKYVGQSDSTQGIAANDGGNYAHYSTISASAIAMASWLIKHTDLTAIVDCNSYALQLAGADYFEPASEAQDYGDSMAAVYQDASQFQQQGMSLPSFIAAGGGASTVPILVGGVVIGTILLDKLFDLFK